MGVSADGLLEPTHTPSLLLPSQYDLGFCFFFIVLLSFFSFLGPYLRHVEVPRLGVESELQLPVYTTATATQDPSRVFDLHHSSRQYQILNPLSEARDRTRLLMDTGRVHYC